jgi:hypothetical protein
MEESFPSKSFFWDQIVLSKKYSFEIGFQIVVFDNDILCFNKSLESKNDTDIHIFKVDKLDLHTKSILNLSDSSKSPRYRLSKVITLIILVSSC